LVDELDVTILAKVLAELLIAVELEVFDVADLRRRNGQHESRETTRECWRT
jgi:hypothetical protein